MKSTKQIGRVGVLMGGLGPERDISMSTGEAIAQALSERGHDVVRDRHQAGNDDLAPQAALQISDRPRLLQKLVQQALGDGDELPPGRSLRDPARGPCEEDGAELIFRLLDHPAETWLRDTKFGGCRHELATSGQCDNRPQMLD